MTALALGMGIENAEKVASGIIRQKMNSETIANGKEFKLKTHGHPLSLKVGRPEKKTDRVSLEKVSFETIKELQLNLDLSKRGTQCLVSTIKKSAPVELGVINDLNKAEQNLKDEYSISSITCEVNGDELCQRDIVFVKDIQSFILNIMEQRKLDPKKAFVRVGIDGGSGFLKVCISIFELDELKNLTENSANLGSGVQKLQFLAIVEDIPETYNNMKTILDHLNLDSLPFYIAWDLKLANMLLGLSSHGAKFGCLFCEGEKNQN